MPDDLTPAAGAPEGLPDLSALGGGGEGDGGLDMGSLLGMAMDMQQQLLAAQSAAAQTLVEGQSGGGVVSISVTGDLVFQSVSIDPDAVDPEDVEMLQDLVLAALHDAVARVNEITQASNPMAGMGLGDMGGLGDLSGMLGLGAASDDDDEDADDGSEDDGPTAPGARAPE